MDISESEVKELKSQISTLSHKFDRVSESVVNIENLLAEQRGQNLALRVHSMENEVQKMRVYQAERSWIPEAVNAQAASITDINKFRYKAVGVLLVAQVVFTGIGVAIFKYLYAASQ